MGILQEIRCPTCHHRQCDAWLEGLSCVVVVCRCRTKYRTDAQETLVITAAASVSRTFDGRRYDGFGLATR